MNNEQLTINVLNVLLLSVSLINLYLPGLEIFGLDGMRQFFQRAAGTSGGRPAKLLADPDKQGVIFIEEFMVSRQI